MVMPARDPKALTEWLELDSFQRPRRMRYLYRLVCGVVFACGLLFVGWSLLPANRSLYQAGALSSAHAILQEDCARCHTESFATLSRLWRGDQVRSTPDEACTACHSGAIHHVRQLAAPGCASCHREHQGTPELSRVADGHCLACHRDLKHHLTAGEQTQFADITSFASHPDFVRRWEGAPSDPGTIRFNHHVHLNPRGVPVLDARQVQAQWGQTASEPVKPLAVKVLKCQDCHEPDEAGRLMKPIRYEAHCQACHPLGVQLHATAPTPADAAAFRQFAAEPAPHREPAVVRAVLRQRLTDLVQLVPSLRGQKEPEQPRPVPGRRPRSQPVTEREYQWVNEQWKGIEQVLFERPGGCAYCHRRTEDAAVAARGLPAFAPSSINERRFALLNGNSPRWFPHSRFSHERHRLLSCTECHPSAPRSEDTADVLMPTLADCRACHGRPGASARSDCIECHGYHPEGKQREFVGHGQISEFARHGR